MNVRFKEVLGAAGRGTGWQPRKTRHSAISIASEHGVSIEDLADMARHVNRNVTRAVYRHVISDTVTRAPRRAGPGAGCGG
jgi:integrase